MTFQNYNHKLPWIRETVLYDSHLDEAFIEETGLVVAQNGLILLDEEDYRQIGVN